MNSMKDKVALVTGAGSGIGRASALAFAREGASVVVSDIAAPAGEETERLVKDSGGNASFVGCDVTRSDQVQGLVAKTMAAHGRLDYAHNNAGIPGPRVPTADCAEADWDRVLAVNLKGIWLCMKSELAEMVRRGGGAIVNTSSIRALAGAKGAAPYAAASHGIVGLTKSAAMEYAGARIRVNAICPGVVRTPMIETMLGGNSSAEAQMIGRIPMGRMGSPEDIAEAVVWLCSDKAAFITGHCLVVDGGQMA